MIVKGYFTYKIFGAYNAAQEECSHVLRRTPSALYKCEWYSDHSLCDIYYHRRAIALTEKAFISFLKEVERDLTKNPSSIRWQRVLTRNLKSIKPSMIDLGWRDKHGYFGEEDKRLLRLALER